MIRICKLYLLKAGRWCKTQFVVVIVHCLIKRPARLCKPWCRWMYYCRCFSFCFFFSLHCFVLHFLVCLLMLFVCYDLLMGHFLISINILNIKNITSRSIESSSSFTGIRRPVGRVSAPRNGEWEVTGSIQGYDIPKLLKWYSLGTQTYGAELGLVDPVSG